MEMMDKIEIKIINLLAKSLKGYEFKTFLLGFKQQDLHNNLKNQYRFELAKKISKKLDLLDPDLHIIIDLKTLKIQIRTKPIFIYGRYKKFCRDIPQTYWGKKYRSSVEEQIGFPIKKHLMAEYFSFHGAGREDVDVLMLGTGRPFVLEVRNAKTKKIDFSKITKEINKSKDINVSGLKFCKKSDVSRIKESQWEKVYRAKVEFKEIPDKLKLFEAIQTLNGAEINQRTPIRVSRRRSDLIRKRKIFVFKMEKMSKFEAIFKIKAESGTYIKELISGDNNRTNPSLSSLLGIDCKIKELDVIKIIG